MQPSRFELLKKIASMVGLHALNSLLPLATLPYVVRTLGLNGFGAIGLALAITQYLLLITEYGFTLSASREVARLQDDHSRISELFWSVQFTKLLLMVLAFICLICAVNIVQTFAQQKNVIYIAFIIIVGHFATPTWLFLGKESMDRLVIFTIIPRLLVIPATFILVNSPDDVRLAMAVQSLPILVTGLISLCYIYRKRWVVAGWPSFQLVRDQLLKGWPLFVSSFSTSFYTSSTPLCLGLLSGNTAVGIFVAADKIRTAAQSLITPVGQVIFPRLNALLERDVMMAFKTMRQVLIFQGGANFVFSMMLLIFAAPIVTLAYSSAATGTSDVLRILAPIVFFVGMSTVFGTHVMIPLSMSKAFSRIVLLAGISHLCVLIPLAYLYGAVGAAITLGVTELTILVAMSIYLSKFSAAQSKLDSDKSILTIIIRGLRPRAASQ